MMAINFRLLAMMNEPSVFHSVVIFLVNEKNVSKSM